MIVVDENHHVRRFPGDPVPGPVKTFEHGCPVGFRRFSLIQCRADRRHVTAADSGGNASHYCSDSSAAKAFCLLESCPCVERPPPTIIAV